MDNKTREFVLREAEQNAGFCSVESDGGSADGDAGASGGVCFGFEV